MRALFISLLLPVLVLTGCSTVSESVTSTGAYRSDAQWAASATFTDSCCCAPSCPCLFGSPATLGHCDGVTFLEFHRAHYGDVSLDGVNVVAVYRSGRSMNYYVSDEATEAQTDAVVKLIPKYIEFYDLKKVTSVDNVPIKVERDSDRIKVTTPKASLEMTVMKGKDGKPIMLENMPAPGFPAPAFLEHTQFQSVSLVHKGKDEEFDYTGTNGFVAKLATASSGD